MASFAALYYFIVSVEYSYTECVILRKLIVIFFNDHSYIL